MGGLVDVVADPARRRKLAVDGASLVDAEAATKSGLSGMAVRAALKGMRAVRPDFVEDALNALLPSFAPALDPHWDRAVGEGDPDLYFRARAREVADALLAVTDARAAKSKHPTVARAYKGLRAQARPHVESAVPRLPALIRRHVTGGT